MATAREKQSLQTVMQNLNQEVQKIKGRTMPGLIQAAAHIRRDMDQTPPKILVDTGNLRQSWFTTRIHQKLRPILIMGFSANYAFYVHEMVDADFQTPRWRYRPEAAARGPRGGRRIWVIPREGAGAKFLEAALNRNHQEILRIIRREAQIR